MFNLRDKLKERINLNPTNTAIQFRENDRWHNISYRELGIGIKSLSMHLLEEGVQKGNKIGIAVEN
ncbi:MAG: hypothetical protein HQ579_02655, partial [Candidatus Omnitrophica bacterium]|nr:hypothetical protein [Candidatus Omnitrophota bacterium]